MSYEMMMLNKSSLLLPWLHIPRMHVCSMYVRRAAGDYSMDSTHRPVGLVGWLLVWQNERVLYLTKWDLVEGSEMETVSLACFRLGMQGHSLPRQKVLGVMKDGLSGNTVG